MPGIDAEGSSAEGTADFALRWAFVLFGLIVSRPSGTYAITNEVPALKRRAITTNPFGIIDFQATAVAARPYG